jgi:hypothetical protein
VKLPQQQTTAVAGDRPAIELRPDLSSLLRMKSQGKLVTLCSHKAVAPSWQNFFLIKELCHGATAFFYLFIVRNSR